MVYEYIESINAAAVLAFTPEGKVILTRQYRHPLRKTIYDLPAGGIKPGETSDQAAQRELMEETGYQAKKINLLGSFYPSPGLHSGKVYVYVANELDRGEPQLDENEIIEIEPMDWQAVLDLVQTEEAVDVTLAYAVLRYTLTNQTLPNPNYA